jgi:hypothetical protein
MSRISGISKAITINVANEVGVTKVVEEIHRCIYKYGSIAQIVVNVNGVEQSIPPEPAKEEAKKPKAAKGDPAPADESLL